MKQWVVFEKGKKQKDLASKGGKFTQRDAWARYEETVAAAKPTQQIRVLEQK